MFMDLYKKRQWAVIFIYIMCTLQDKDQKKKSRNRTLSNYPFPLNKGARYQLCLDMRAQAVSLIGLHTPIFLFTFYLFRSQYVRSIPGDDSDDWKMSNSSGYRTKSNLPECDEGSAVIYKDLWTQDKIHKRHVIMSNLK